MGMKKQPEGRKIHSGPQWDLFQSPLALVHSVVKSEVKAVTDTSHRNLSDMVDKPMVANFRVVRCVR